MILRKTNHMIGKNYHEERTKQKELKNNWLADYLSHNLGDMMQINPFHIAIYLHTLHPVLIFNRWQTRGFKMDLSRL